MKIKVETNVELFYFKLKTFNSSPIHGYVYPKDSEMEKYWDKVIGYSQEDEDEFFDKKCYTSIYDVNDIDNFPIYGHVIFDLDEDIAFYFKLKYGEYVS